MSPFSHAYTYDKAGNQVSETDTSTGVTTTYTYDYHNRLTGVDVGGTVVATYTYDALGRRIGIDDNGSQTWTVYDGKNPYADFHGSGAVAERYASGPGVVNGAAVDELLARTSAGGATAWYLTNKLGSVRDIVDTSGSELDHVVYDSFGNIISESSPSSGDRFKYAGMEYDTAAGVYYDRKRYYDPLTNRFLSQDPLSFAGGDANLYRYVDNGPEDAVDPDGTSILGGVQSVYNWLFTGNASASQSEYEAAVQGAGQYLYQYSPVRGGYVYGGVSISEHETIVIQGYDIDEGMTTGVIFAPGKEIGPVAINVGTDYTYHWEDGHWTSEWIVLGNVDAGPDKVPPGVFPGFKPTPGIPINDVGAWVTSDRVGLYTGYSGHTFFGGIGVTIDPARVPNIFNSDYWMGRLPVNK